MDKHSFVLGLRSLAQQLPYGKRPEADELAYLWMVLPQSATEQVSDQMWAYALQQRLLDPHPNHDLPVVMQLFSYLYRCRNGHPAFELGLRPDLPQRLAQASRFHSLEVARPESALVDAAALLPPAPPRPAETPQQRRRRLLAFAESMGFDLSQPVPSSPEPNTP